MFDDTLLVRKRFFFNIIVCLKMKMTDTFFKIQIIQALEQNVLVSSLSDFLSRITHLYSTVAAPYLPSCKYIFTPIIMR